MKRLYFLLLAAFFTNVLLAQSPGGVSTGLSMWIRADAAATLTVSDAVDSWHYFNNAGPGFVFNSTGVNRPVLQTNTLNFQPSVFFDGTKIMDGPTGDVSPAAPIPLHSQAYSVFGVWQTTSPTPAFQHVWSQKGPGSANDGIEIWTANTGNYGAQLEIGPYFQGAVLPYAPNTWYTSQIDVQAISTSDLTVVDQANLSTGGVVTDSDPNTHDALSARINGLSTDINRLGARNSVGEEALIGNVAEVIVYTTPISGAQRNQIFSYLALKYGIHTGTNLLSSAGTTVWDATANATYNNAVFGIGMDNGSGLSLSKSNSLVTGSGDGTGQSAKGNIVLSNPTTLTDGSFLILGSDNGALTESTGNVPVVATGSQRLGRNFKTQVTGTPGDVDVDVDLNGLTVTGTTTTDFRLVLDDDGDGDFTTGSARWYTPSTFTSNIAHFSAVTLNNNTVMGIITGATPVTPLPVIWNGFTAAAAGNDVNLNWQVSSNESGKVYMVEHSLDGAHFTSIGSVVNVPSQKSYKYTHEGAGPGTHYYRIHEVDVDGKDIYSKIQSAAIKVTDFSVRALSNPVSGSVDPEVEINAVRAGKASIEIWTEGGSYIGTLQQTVNTGSNRVRVSLGARPSATYFLKVRLNDASKTIQIVKL